MTFHFLELFLLLLPSIVFLRFISTKPTRKSPTPSGVGLFLVVDGFEKLNATVRWTVAREG